MYVLVLLQYTYINIIHGSVLFSNWIEQFSQGRGDVPFPYRLEIIKSFMGKILGQGKYKAQVNIGSCLVNRFANNQTASKLESVLNTSTIAGYELKKCP